MTKVPDHLSGCKVAVRFLPVDLTEEAFRLSIPPTYTNQITSFSYLPNERVDTKGGRKSQTSAGAAGGAGAGGSGTVLQNSIGFDDDEVYGLGLIQFTNRDWAQLFEREYSNHIFRTANSVEYKPITAAAPNQRTCNYNIKSIQEFVDSQRKKRKYDFTNQETGVDEKLRLEYLRRNFEFDKDKYVEIGEVGGSSGAEEISKSSEKDKKTKIEDLIGTDGLWRGFDYKSLLKNELFKYFRVLEQSNMLNRDNPVSEAFKEKEGMSSVKEEILAEIQYARKRIKFRQEDTCEKDVDCSNVTPMTQYIRNLYIKAKGSRGGARRGGLPSLDEEEEVLFEIDGFNEGYLDDYNRSSTSRSSGDGTKWYFDEIRISCAACQRRRKCKVLDADLCVCNRCIREDRLTGLEKYKKRILKGMDQNEWIQYEANTKHTQAESSSRGRSRFPLIDSSSKKNEKNDSYHRNDSYHESHLNDEYYNTNSSRYVLDDREERRRKRREWEEERRVICVGCNRTRKCKTLENGTSVCNRCIREERVCIEGVSKLRKKILGEKADEKDVNCDGNETPMLQFMRDMLKNGDTGRGLEFMETRATCKGCDRRRTCKVLDKNLTVCNRCIREGRLEGITADGFASLQAGGSSERSGGERSNDKSEKKSRHADTKVKLLTREKDDDSKNDYSKIEEKVGSKSNEGDKDWTESDWNDYWSLHDKKKKHKKSKKKSKDDSIDDTIIDDTSIIDSSRTSSKISKKSKNNIDENIDKYSNDWNGDWDHHNQKKVDSKSDHSKNKQYKIVSRITEEKDTTKQEKETKTEKKTENYKENISNDKKKSPKTKESKDSSTKSNDYSNKSKDSSTKSKESVSDMSEKKKKCPSCKQIKTLNDGYCKDCWWSWDSKSKKR